MEKDRAENVRDLPFFAEIQTSLVRLLTSEGESL